MATYGKDHVGLLTGDTAVRPDAPMVVMTTEVLRNMLLAGSDLLAGLHTVILDEVHFIQDPYRGGVWEEVLVLSPPEVRFVCLSATVNNANELGAWLRSVRGTTDVIVERHRPIVLRHHFAAHRREDDETLLLPLLVNGKPGNEGIQDRSGRPALPAGTPAAVAAPRQGARGCPIARPLRTELITALKSEEMLPAIVFIFSRAACDEAVRQVVRDGVRLTDGSERATIREIAERRVESLSDEDLGVLGYDDWLEGLECGVASHHAGLVPVFRETVEECFAAGLLQVVFATETLSLGINMPARSVVIERFTKYGGAGRATLTSGEYLQLTGRAGRRGLDEEGHAVVAVVLRDRLQRGGPGGLGAPTRPALVLPPHLQPGRQPGLPLRPGDGRRRAAPLLRPVAGPAGRPPDHPAQPPGGRPGGAGLPRRTGRSPPPGTGSPGSTTSPISCSPRRWRPTSSIGAEPSVLAGVVSAVVFEPRRARRLAGHGGPGGPATGRAARRSRRKGPLADRLGEKRVAELEWRGAALEHVAERIRSVEELISCPAPANPPPGWPPPWPRGPVGPPSRPPWPWRPATWGTWRPGTSCAPSSRWPTWSSRWPTPPPTPRRPPRPGRPSPCSCGAWWPSGCRRPDGRPDGAVTPARPLGASQRVDPGGHPPPAPRPSPMVGRACSRT